LNSAQNFRQGHMHVCMRTHVHACTCVRPHAFDFVDQIFNFHAKNSNLRSFLGQRSVKFEICGKFWSRYTHVCMCVHACTHAYMYLHTHLKHKSLTLMPKNSNVRSFLGKEGVKFKICAKFGVGHMCVRVHVPVCTHTHVYLHVYTL